MEHDRGDSFTFDFDPNGIPFGLKLKSISGSIQQDSEIYFSACHKY